MQTTFDSNFFEGLQQNQFNQGLTSHMMLAEEKPRHQVSGNTISNQEAVISKSPITQDLHKKAIKEAVVGDEEISNLQKTTKKIRFIDDDEDRRIHKDIEKESLPSDMTMIKKVSRRIKYQIDEEEETFLAPIRSKNVDKPLDTTSEIMINTESAFSHARPCFLKEERKIENTLSNTCKEDIIGDLGNNLPNSQDQKKRLKKLTNNHTDKQSNDATKGSVAQQSKDVCSICLSALINETGHIDVCKHIFCYTCIVKWADVTNECPICRIRFKKIIKYSKNNIKLSSTPVEDKVQAQSDDSDEADYEEEIEEFCGICNEDDPSDQLIVCDSCGFCCCHVRCCNPPLTSDSMLEWICSLCQSGEAEESRNQTRTPLTEDPYQLRLRRHQNPGQKTLLEKLFEQVEGNRVNRVPTSNTRATNARINSSSSANRNPPASNSRRGGNNSTGQRSSRRPQSQRRSNRRHH